MGSKESCCFTGHRILPAGELPALRAALRREISNLAEAGVGRFLAGGARGFDMLAAQEVLWLREERYALELVLVLPCPEQADRWNAREKQAYREMVQEADEVIYVSEVYTPDCMFRRNRKLVEESGSCICYLNRERGGTAYTVKYAEKLGLSIVNLAVPRPNSADQEKTLFI
ncbi:SLOG family protein [Neglectibacter timonensis]|uniref:SLOG family protein n=1 Tax=Neglectibacter timonensis TaxID=1776382 RepID=UPI00266C922B|nr:SLOG family protein [Neglectibacter timonensis]